MDSCIVAKFGENWSLGSCRKVVLFCGQKILAVRESPEPPIVPSLSRWRTKFPERCGPFDLCTFTKFGPDRLRFAGVIPERLIFLTPKVILILHGFQPTRTVCCTARVDSATSQQSAATLFGQLYDNTRNVT